VPPARESIWQYFVSKCASNLHIVLAMSPVGETLRTRCRNFPGLVNNASIDWFMPWPKQALCAVASVFLGEQVGWRYFLYSLWCELFPPWYIYWLYCILTSNTFCESTLPSWKFPTYMFVVLIYYYCLCSWCCCRRRRRCCCCRCCRRRRRRSCRRSCFRHSCCRCCWYYSETL
jgi:hypothetical protein